jgi:hypothetical protein
MPSLMMKKAAPPISAIIVVVGEPLEKVLTSTI